MFILWYSNLAKNAAPVDKEYKKNCQQEITDTISIKRLYDGDTLLRVELGSGDCVRGERFLCGDERERAPKSLIP
jgi:hypothetical protein